MYNIMVTGAGGFLGKEISNSFFKEKYKLFPTTRQILDLKDSQKVKDFIYKNKIDIIVHCAVMGGRRTRVDTAQDYYDNILIFENLISNLSQLSLFINFDSGASFDRRRNIHRFSEEKISESIPIDFYGSSKYTICKRIQLLEKCINLRIFGCFSPNEEDTRLIKNNVKKYINNENMILHQNKEMDYFYFEDVLRVVDNYINNINNLNSLPKDINLSYQDKFSLLDILHTINNLEEKKVDIIQGDSNLTNSYSGDGKKLSSLNLNLDGIQYGIRSVYETLRKKDDR